MIDKEMREEIVLAANETINLFMLRVFGIDVQDINELHSLREDFRHLRKHRLVLETTGETIAKASIGVVITALLAAIGTAVMYALHLQDHAGKMGG